MVGYWTNETLNIFQTYAIKNTRPLRFAIISIQYVKDLAYLKTTFSSKCKMFMKYFNVVAVTIL